MTLRIKTPNNCVKAKVKSSESSFPPSPNLGTPLAGQEAGTGVCTVVCLPSEGAAAVPVLAEWRAARLCHVPVPALAGCHPQLPRVRLLHRNGAVPASVATLWLRV